VPHIVHNYLSGIASKSESNALTFPWTLPTPGNERPIVDGVMINPVEELLLCLQIKNNLPKHMYPAIMEWAHHAYLQDYDYSHNLSYQAVLCPMMKKYVHVSCAPKG
jgi:hypothetical protein